MAGGARPGAGRKPGVSATPQARAQARAAAQAELLPLEIMLKTMAKHWHASEDKSKSPKERAEAEAAAVSVAKDAAPYIHSKLQSTTVKGDKENPLQFILDLPNDNELRKAIRGE